MQISDFTKIVIFVTSLGFAFLSCIALFIFYFCLALLLLLLYSLECAGVFRSCGSDLRWLLAPLKIPSPAGLSWTSLWGALYICDCGGRHFTAHSETQTAALNKKQKRHKILNHSSFLFIINKIYIYARSICGIII